MKAIILAAGYATRLRPLTDTTAKPLLPVGGQPIIKHIYEKIVAIGEVDAVHVVTNARFAEPFTRWAHGVSGRLKVQVHNDGTTTNDNRLGAIGDIRFTADRAELWDEDLLVVAGDNLFEFSLADFVKFFRKKGDGSCLALYQCPDRELVKQYSTVEVDQNVRITKFIEKPKDPKTNLVGTATYLYHRKHVPLVREYLSAGNSPDQPGNFIAWLHTRVPVYGYGFEGAWLDIGDHAQLLAADNQMRSAAGLPPREKYSLE